MKYFRLALVALIIISGLTALRAQEGAPPQEEIITDFGIDEFIYVPKYTLRVGMRLLSGPKTSFSGFGTASDIAPPTDITTANIPRLYNDGYVLKDTRSTVDIDGNTLPINADGYTNSWSYNFPGQVGADGNMAFHSYTAAMTDPGLQKQNADLSAGVEVIVSRDMGKLSKKLDWTVFAGLSLNELNSSKSENVAATITTVTDYYSLNGQTAPTPPYTAPTTSPITVTAPNGTTSTVISDNTTLLGSQPLARVTTVSNGIVYTRWHLKGAYFTLRTGPSLSYSITDRLKASVSVGGALVFAGTTYTVDEVYAPTVGNDVGSELFDTKEKLLPGYYADATLEYTFSERAGAYAGAFYQSSGSYSQAIANTAGNYATTIDLSSLQGFRMGMNFRF